VVRTVVSVKSGPLPLLTPIGQTPPCPRRMISDDQEHRGEGMPEPDNASRAVPSEGVSVSGDMAGVTVFEVVMAGTLGPLVTAFCTELGKRLGGNVADWASRVRLIHKKKNPDKAVLLVHTGPYYNS